MTPSRTNCHVRDIVMIYFYELVRVQVSVASDCVRAIHTHRLEEHAKHTTPVVRVPRLRLTVLFYPSSSVTATEKADLPIPLTTDLPP